MTRVVQNNRFALIFPRNSRSIKRQTQEICQTRNKIVKFSTELIAFDYLKLIVLLGRMSAFAFLQKPLLNWFDS